MANFVKSMPILEGDINKVYNLKSPNSIFYVAKSKVCVERKHLQQNYKKFAQSTRKNSFKLL